MGQYGEDTTTDQVLEGIDLTGRRVVITGAASGLGFESARALADHGATVTVLARSAEKADGAVTQLTELVPDGSFEAGVVDLADLATVHAFADTYLADHDAIDVLVNNAGVMACPFAHTADGFEMQFGINHLGHFALTQALMPLLVKTPGARVVSLSSTAHKISDIRWDDLHFAQGYNKWKAYGQAKTANALFANALSRRLAEHGGLAFSVHPGGILTPLQRHLPHEEMVALGWIDESGNISPSVAAMFKTPEQGCSTTLWAATSPALEGMAGVYCEDCNVAAPTDPASPTAGWQGVDAHACDDDGAERLWDLSERLLAEA